MTLYARSDLTLVALSPAHGGCGAPHARPVTHGAPAATWALDCPACEQHLRSDPHWAVMPSEVPETPDEVKIREDAEKRGQRDTQDQMRSAILSLAESHEKLPAQLVDAFAAVGAYLGGRAESVSCPQGHQQTVTAKFCGECGTPMGGINPADLPVVQLGDVPPPAELVKMTVADLRVLAADRGVAVSGSKSDLIGRLVG